MTGTRGWKRDERGVEKTGKRDDWYKRGGDEAVIFVPATPGSQLQKKYQSEIRKQGYKIKVGEKMGTTLKKMLQKSNPFKQQRCGRENCLVCKQAGRGPCNAHSVTYEIECQGSENKYVGETARIAYTTGTELRKSRRKISIMEALHRKAWEGTTRVQNVRDWSVW